MLKFDEQLYLKDGKTTYETRGKIEQIADEISKEGYKNIFFISVGGSIAIMLPVVEMLKQLTDVPIYAEQAAEVVLTGHRQLTKDSIVIMSSKSGDTKETVRAAEWCKENGYRVVSLVGTPDAPLEKLSRWVIPNRAKDGVEFEYMELFMLVFRLLANRNEFPKYNQFADQLEKLPENLVKAKQKFEPIADEIAKNYYNEPYNIWVGDGEMWGEVYLFSMCVVEEMQWIRTKAVSSSEFFHGTLELVSDNVPVFLVKGEGKRRVLDERVEKFCKQYTKKLVVIDTKDYELEGIDDDFRWILAPTISTTLLVDRLAFHYEKYTGHDLDIRRYYRQFDY
ncbi:SIS domain-containing protein [Virgibacillus dakarensis]|uniref:Fructosamine deglycase n=1 Tax=Lentibacillus populi TaxID=1827502 RepID=A0A9W5TY85_9BACI|nr:MULTISPECIES: SIS domain-containing protein [Bacillaceae]MBT2216399.1 SIS domain-containing protein [Virgibacillus dakarensis]MTW86589.1 SIS domain-containing protein [Virgibacillus dakarensis]GGB47199.1 glucosamine--fructose-6-phosphate aminotransferase [Lentibacillus populi]